MKVSVPPLLVRQDDTVSTAAAVRDSSSAVILFCSEENIWTLDEEDVLGNTGSVDAVEVGLEGGGDAAVLLAEFGGELDVTVALGGQDEVGPCVDGVLPSALRVNAPCCSMKLKHIMLALPWEDAAPKRTERRIPAM